MKPGERVKELRLKNKLNQVEFADILGYSDAYVSEIETGKKEISIDFTDAIEKKFHVSRAYILYGLSDDRWNSIKEYLRSEGLLPESVEKLFPVLYSEDKELSAFQVEEATPEYAVDLRERRLPKNASKRDFIEKVIKIYDCENEIIAKALRANIEAFLYALRFEHSAPPEDKKKEGD